VRYHVYASSFADPADVRRFKKWFAIYKSQGKSDEEAFDLALAKGDNGEGCWKDDTSEGSGPSCALPPETMIDIWGSVDAAKRQKVFVECGERSVTCLVKDKMPHIAHITNGARIDLNPDACDALDLEPPVMHFVTFTPLKVA
jgi:hypothetical protein